MHLALDEAELNERERDDDGHQHDRLHRRAAEIERLEAVLVNLVDQDRGRGAGATTTMVYKVYADGRLGGDLGGSAAQSVVLMVIVIALTAVQFKYVERKVQY